MAEHGASLAAAFRLRRARIRGFKAIVDLDLRLPADLLILIGGNGSGKSSILQSLAFVQYVAKGNSSAFFQDRGWIPSELRTRIKTNLRSGIISYRLHLENGRGQKIYWHFWWNLNESKMDHEEIWFQDKNDEQPIFIVYCHDSKIKIIGSEQDIIGIKLQGSVINVLDLESFGEPIKRTLSAVKEWATGIFSLELLSPSEMRRGVRGSPLDIGPQGERLGGFLASLSTERKHRLVSRLGNFYPIDDVETTRKRAGWVDLKISEQYDNLGKIGAQHVSDGFMRLLGLASIPEFGSEISTVLLDEVEDGIEPHILPDFVKLIARESQSQLILTSHSPILVNSFSPENIAFCSRSNEGRTYAKSFSKLDTLVRGLDYFGPGEVWTNADMTDINRMVLTSSGIDNGSNLSINPSKKLSAFQEVAAFLRGE